jgi:hypothetical protein
MQGKYDACFRPPRARRVNSSFATIRALRAERLGCARAQKDPQAATHGRSHSFLSQDGADESYGDDPVAPAPDLSRARPGWFSGPFPTVPAES